MPPKKLSKLIQEAPVNSDAEAKLGEVLLDLARRRAYAKWKQVGPAFDRSTIAASVAAKLLRDIKDGNAAPKSSDQLRGLLNHRLWNKAVEAIRRLNAQKRTSPGITQVDDYEDMRQSVPEIAIANEVIGRCEDIIDESDNPLRRKVSRLMLIEGLSPGRIVEILKQDDAKAEVPAKSTMRVWSGQDLRRIKARLGDDNE